MLFSDFTPRCHCTSLFLKLVRHDLFVASHLESSYNPIASELLPYHAMSPTEKYYEIF